MPLTDRLPTYILASDYFNAILEYYNEYGVMDDDTELIELQDRVEPDILQDLEQESCDDADALLLDFEQELPVWESEKAFTDQENSLKLKQAMGLFMSRSVCAWLSNTDRDLGEPKTNE